jgi:hypothetical protein
MTDLIVGSRDKLPEIYPDRSHTPKTLIFAKGQNHAENIVEIVREECGKGNEFAPSRSARRHGQPCAFVRPGESDRHWHRHQAAGDGGVHAR